MRSHWNPDLRESYVVVDNVFAYAIASKFINDFASKPQTIKEYPQWSDWSYWRRNKIQAKLGSLS